MVLHGKVTMPLPATRFGIQEDLLCIWTFLVQDLHCRGMFTLSYVEGVNLSTWLRGGSDEWGRFKQLHLVPLTTQMKLSRERMNNDVSIFLKMIPVLQTPHNSNSGKCWSEGWITMRRIAVGFLRWAKSVACVWNMQTLMQISQSNIARRHTIS